MEKENYKDIILEQFIKINELYDKHKDISIEEKYKTFLLIKMAAKKGESNTIFHISRLDVRHNCYPTLQQSYRIISKEASFALNNPTDDNLLLIMGQFGILLSLEEYLKQEDKIPLEILMEMNERCVLAVDKSSKVFKKINKISK